MITFKEFYDSLKQQRKFKIKYYFDDEEVEYEVPLNEVYDFIYEDIVSKYFNNVEISEEIKLGMYDMFYNEGYEDTYYDLLKENYEYDAYCYWGAL